MNVGLVRDPAVVEHIRTMFGSRGREMAASNERQADRPEGADFITNPLGTAPGLICPVGHKIVYAVPGVPYEMQEMVGSVVLPDLQRRSGDTSVILSRTLRTWGTAESTLAEMVAPRVEALDAAGNPTIAFLASGIEGIKIRITAKGPDTAAARALLTAEEDELRALLGPLVFGADEESMEHAVAVLLDAHQLTLGVAESLTGGLVGARLASVAGASGFFRGSVVAYDREVKFDVLGVPRGPVVSEEAVVAMADGARKVLGADVGIAVTGVAGPAEQDGQPVGTVFLGLSLGDNTEAMQARLPGDRERVRQFACISLLNLLRMRLLEL
jgi:nicotinamide-nucleotide amidase